MKKNQTGKFLLQARRFSIKRILYLDTRILAPGNRLPSQALCSPDRCVPAPHLGDRCDRGTPLPPCLSSGMCPGLKCEVLSWSEVGHMTCSKEERLKAWRKCLPVPDTAPVFTLHWRTGVSAEGQEEVHYKGGWRRKTFRVTQKRQPSWWPARAKVFRMVFMGVVLHQLSKEQTLRIVTSWEEHTADQTQKVDTKMWSCDQKKKKEVIIF